jgi:hypothetical protein
MQPFLAMILPVSGGVPTHPIAPGGPPPRPWGPINYPDQGLPGNQPYPDQGLPGQQPGIWGGGGVGNYPDAGFPGPQPGGPVRPWGPINYPDQGLPGAQPVPGRPSHPIYYPPVIWDPSRPTNPIANPGDPNNPGAGQAEQGPKIEWKTAWSPSTGWIVVGVPTGEHVTPSEEDE